MLILLLNLLNHENLGCLSKLLNTLWGLLILKVSFKGIDNNWSHSIQKELQVTQDFWIIRIFM
jgi:hypothetical protein